MLSKTMFPKRTLHDLKYCICFPYYVLFLFIINGLVFTSITLRHYKNASGQYLELERQ